MQLDYNWDVYEEFREEIDFQLVPIEKNILLLHDSESVSESISYLFRTFHSFKANANYLSLDSLHKLVSKVETVLSILREEDRVVQDSIIEWFLQVYDQICSWHDKMQTNETNLTPAPSSLLNVVCTTTSYTSPSNTLKKLTILYIDNKKERAKKMLSYLKKLSKNITYMQNIEDAKSYIVSNKVNILITNLNEKNYELIDFAKESCVNLPVIPIFDTVDKEVTKKLLKKSISHAIKNPINIKNLQKELLSIIKAFYSSKHIIINNKKIIQFINTLKPLPNTIFKIVQVCDDDEIPIKELIKVVKTDPVISANILNISNSPLYGNVEIRTVDQAVAKFGKKVIKSLAMSNIYCSLNTLDLTAYEIDEDTFSKVSMLRLSLMLKWYSKISIADLSVLSSTALLGNIGQLLISKELSKSDRSDEFQLLCKTKSILFAEETILHTNTTTISSQILRYWKLSDDIVDIISFSKAPKQAPKEIRKLCVANYIVYRLIDIKGEIATDIYSDLLPLMEEYDFKEEPLQKALDSLN